MSPAALPAPTLGDRALFPELEAASYLAHCAVAPVSTPVAAAIADTTLAYARLGLGAVRPALAQRELLRAELAAFLNAPAPSDVAFTSGTTAGVIAIAQGFPWRSGDAVVLLRGEFPTNVTPWLVAARQYGLAVRWLDADALRPDGPGLDQLARTLSDGKVRLIAVSAVEFQTGLRLPVAALGALAHAHGAALFVDAIQACGASPVDLVAMHIDFLACGAHKWLGGIEGAGFLYVAPQHAATLRPTVAGWLSHEEPVGFLFGGPGLLRYDRPLRARADMVEAGSASTVGFAALRAALSLITALGVPAIAAHIAAFHDRLAPTLLALGFTDLRPADPAGRSGILALRAPADLPLGAVREGLAARGVVVTTPDGVLRVAPHGFTPLAEADLAAAAFTAVAAELRA